MLRWVRGILALVVVLPGVVVLAAEPAAAYDQEMVYAIGTPGDRVVVVDPAKPGISQTIIPVAPGANAIVLSPDGRRAYVAHRGSAPSISIIDTVIDKVVDTVPLPGEAWWLTMSPDGKRLWLAISLSSPGNDWLGSVETATGILQDVHIDLDGIGCRIGVTPTLVSSVCRRGESTSLDLQTGEVLRGELYSDGVMWGLVVDAATNRLWTYENTEIAIHVADARTFAELDRFDLEELAYGGGLVSLPGAGQLFHALDDGRIVTIDRNTAATQVVGTVPGSPEAIQIGDSASRVYLSVTGGTLVRLDTATGASTPLFSGLPGNYVQEFAVGDVPQLPYLDFQAALAVMAAVGPAYTWTARLRNADARLSAEARATLMFVGTAVEVTGVRAPTGVRCSVVRGGVRCDLGRIPPGGTVPVEVRVRPADGGTVRGTLTVTSDHPDPNPRDNTVTASTGPRR